MTRIAFVLSQDRGGPADVTLALVRAMLEDGQHDVRLFGPPPAQDCDWLDGHFTDMRVDSKGDIGAARRMRAELRAWQPDIVHAQDRRSALVTAGLDRLPGGPRAVVQTYHGVPDDTTQSWFGGAEHAAAPSVRTRAVLAADALVARVISRIVVPSTTMGAFLTSRLRVPAAKVVHIDNGVFLPRARPSHGPIRRLLFVGLLVPRKGLTDLLHALNRPGVMPADCTLAIAGDGPSRHEAEALSRRPPLAGRVHFLGYRTDVADLLIDHDALVLPSRMEQQPLVVAQAMGAGRPVLATRTGGVAEMLEIAGQPDYLAAPGDIDALASTLKRLFENPQPQRLGEKLSARARQRYSAEASAVAHVRLYDEMLARCVLRRPL
jgi:glycosyltransferase involved in cell wall biosynthesis